MVHVSKSQRYSQVKDKRIILLVFFLCGIAFIIYSLRQKNISDSGNNSTESHSLDFTVSDVRGGKKVSFSDVKGKVLFINFWASWCQPCREEMPSIEALYREMKSNNDFAMITILYNDDPLNALEYLRSGGYGFPVYSDPEGRSSKNYGVTGVPETYIVDKKGVLRKRVLGGADWNSAEAKSFINDLLKE